MTNSTDDLLEAADDMRTEAKVTPKPGPPPVHNWQVQNLSGQSYGDYTSEEEAKIAALRARNDYQRPIRVRQTA